MDILFLMKQALSGFTPQETLFMKYVAVKRRANIAKVPYISEYDKLFLSYYESLYNDCEDEYIAETIGDIPLILRKLQLQGLIVKKYKITEERINVLEIPFKKEFNEYVEPYFFAEY